MKSKIFEFALFYNPNIEDRDDTRKAVLIETGTLCAKDDATARLLASRRIPAIYEDMMEDVEVVVRSF